MNRSRVHIGLFVIGFGLLLLPLTLSAQAREIITKQITLGNSVAELSLEFTGDGRLDVTFDDGLVQLDGQVVGRIDPGGRLEAAWRSLLEGTARLEDGPLAERLLAWSAPGGLAVEVDSIAREIEQALQDALESVDTQTQTRQVEASVLIEIEDSVVGPLERAREQEAEIRNRIRIDVELWEELREEIREEIREKITLTATRRGDSPGVGGNVFLGLFSLIGNLLLIAALSFIGGALVRLGGGPVDTIAETACRSPGRSALVGLAGTLLLTPVWLLGFLGLLISIIGIPLAFMWLPLFWVLVSLAAITGFVSVAHKVGEWAAVSDLPWTDRIQKSNSFHTVFVGLFLLLLAFLVAEAVSILPFSGFLAGVLVFIGCVVTVAASLIGFGAVLISGAGHWRGFRYTKSDTGVADQETDGPEEVNTDEDG